MKMSSLSVSVMILLAVVFDGRGQAYGELVLTNSGGRIQMITTNLPPNNCLVIHNHTTNNLEIFNGNVPWEMKVKYQGRIISVPVMVEPLETLVLQNLFEAAHQTNQAVMTVQAEYCVLVGDAIFEPKAGKHDYALHGLSTNSLPIVIDVNQKDFQAK